MIGPLRINATVLGSNGATNGPSKGGTGERNTTDAPGEEALEDEEETIGEEEGTADEDEETIEEGEETDEEGH